jgi:hypothetical protein
MSLALKSLRAAAVFIGNLLTAIVGTAIIFSPIKDLSHPQKTCDRLLTTDILGAVGAAILGYLVYNKWRMSSARWVWLTGVSWWGLGALHIAPRNGGDLFFEFFCRTSSGDIPNLQDWSSFTTPLVRTVFYSIGAFCCTFIKRIWSR